MTLSAYPLEQVLEIKERRVEEAERVAREKEEALEQEKEKLKAAEEQRDKALQHKQDKLTQLREEMDRPTTSPKIQQMKDYLKICDEKVKIEEKKVEDQKEQVAIAEKNLEEAKEELRIKRMEVDKIKTHREDWMIEMKEEFRYAEEQELDESGTLMYAMRKRRGF